MNTCIKRLVFPALLLVLILGCADNAPQESSLPADEAVVVEDESASATGSISGSVTLKEPPRALIFVALGKSYDDLSLGRVSHGRVMREPGPFRFDGVRPGKYRVGAFVDLNRNRVPDIPVEPYVINPDAISVSPGEHVEGVSIADFFNEREKAFKTPERIEQYERMLAESKELVERAYEKLKAEQSALLYEVMPSLRAMIYEAERVWPVAGNLSDWEHITGMLGPVPELARSALGGKDLLGTLRGCFLRAYVSELDESVQRYALAVPEAYDGSRPFPLIIALHGGGGDHWSGMKMIAGYSAFVIGAEESNDHFFPRTLPPDFIIACPNGHGYKGPGYRDKGEYDVMKVFKEMFSNYNIDSDRVYLAGSSKGGTGTWEIGMKYSEMFAAISPVCGRPSFAEKHVGSSGDMKFFVFHGRTDKFMPVELSRKMVVMLTEAGADVEYVEYEDWGHEASALAYGDGRIIRLFRE